MKIRQNQAKLSTAQRQAVVNAVLQLKKQATALPLDPRCPA